MADLLNQSQRWQVEIALRSIEESLRKTEVWLSRTEESGLLLRRSYCLSPQGRAAVREEVGAALQQIAELVEVLELRPQQQDVGQTLASDLSMDRIHLSECYSSDLRGFGAVDPELAEVLDSRLEGLSQRVRTLEYFLRDMKRA